MADCCDELRRTQALLELTSKRLAELSKSRLEKGRALRDEREQTGKFKRMNEQLKKEILRLQKP